jgi:hypothetical protein
MVDVDKFRFELERLIDEAQEALNPHNSIRADDDQYEDVEEWILIPLIKHLKSAMQSLDN